jgi:hypothetical protein
MQVECTYKNENGEGLLDGVNLIKKWKRCLFQSLGAYRRKLIQQRSRFSFIVPFAKASGSYHCNRGYFSSTENNHQTKPIPSRFIGITRLQMTSPIIFDSFARVSVFDQSYRIPKCFCCSVHGGISHISVQTHVFSLSRISFIVTPEISEVTQ